MFFIYWYINDTGNVKFIGELFKLEILNERIVYLCISNLLPPIRSQSSEVNEDDNLECLCKLLFTIGLQLDKKESVRVILFAIWLDSLTITVLVSSLFHFNLEQIRPGFQGGWASCRRVEFSAINAHALPHEGRAGAAREELAATKCGGDDDRRSEDARADPPRGGQRGAGAQELLGAHERHADLHAELPASNVRPSARLRTAAAYGNAAVRLRCASVRSALQLRLEAKLQRVQLALLYNASLSTISFRFYDHFMHILSNRSLCAFAVHLYFCNASYALRIFMN